MATPKLARDTTADARVAELEQLFDVLLGRMQSLEDARLSDRVREAERRRRDVALLRASITARLLAPDATAADVTRAGRLADAVLRDCGLVEVPRED